MKKFIKHLKKQSTRGFSLVEILIALTLLALAGTFVVGKVFEKFEEGRNSAAEILIQTLAQRVQEYRLSCDAYPTSDQGLEALVRKPSGGKECRRYPPGGFIDKGEVPLDPWENEFVYQSDGMTFDIVSPGRDGEVNTGDDIAYQKKRSSNKTTSEE